MNLMMEELTKAFDEIGRGNLGYRIASDAEGEAGQLVAAFNAMAATLQREGAAFRESETQLHPLVESAEVFIYRMTLPDGTYEYVNAASFALTGYTPEEFYNSPKLIEHFIHPDWEPYFAVQWENLLKGDMSPFYEYQIVHRSGEVRWLHQHNGLVRNDAGAPVAIEGMVTDITKRKEVEAALQQSEERLRLLLENTEDIIFMQDLEGRYLYYNGPSVYGLEPEDVVGKTPSDFFDADTVACLEENLQQVISSGQRLVVENRLVWHGQTLWFLDEINPIYDQGGRIVALSVISRNITELKQAEEALRQYRDDLEDLVKVRTAELEQEIMERKRTEVALRESAEALRRERDFAEGLVKTAQVIVLVLDNEGRVIRFNPYLEEISGYRLEDVKGKDWFSTFVPERLQEHVRVMFASAVHDIQTRGAVTPIVTKCGYERQIEWYDKTLKDANGDIVGMLAIGQDVTSRLQMQEALRLRNRELSLLNQASYALSSSLDLNQVLTTLLKEAHILIGGTGSLVWLVEPSPQQECAQDKTLVCSYATGPGSEVLLGSQVPLDAGIAGWAVCHSESVIVPDTWADPRYYRKVEEHLELSPRSLLTVPLKAKGSVIGVIQVASSAVDRFSTMDLDLLESLAAIAAIALENARLYEQAQQEIAQRKQAERALSASESKFRSLVKSAEDAIFMQDPADGRILFFHLPRYESLDMVGKLPHEILTPEGARLNLEKVRQVAREGQACTYESDVVWEGRPVCFSVTLSPINGEVAGSVREMDVPKTEHAELPSPWWGEVGAERAPDSKSPGLSKATPQLGCGVKNIVAVMGIARDLTEQKRLQAGMAHAEKMAALGRLAASLAHEINNPLQSVLGHIRLSQEEVEDCEQQEKMERYLTIAATEIKRVSEIVDRMHDFCRRSRSDMVLVDVQALVESVLALSASQLQQCAVTVVRTYTDALPLIQANPDHLKQAFLNLVLNATDAMPRGGTLHIHTALGAPAAPKAIEIAFEDTGTGISPEVQGRLFEPFFTTKDNGTGLGLSISYSIIEAHNGKIAVASQPGKGTTFTVSLPVHQPDAGAALGA